MPASMKHIVSIPWSDEERTLLRQMHETGMGPTAIGRQIGRSAHSVAKQIVTLHLGPRGSTAPPHTPRALPPPRQPRPQPLRPGARTLPPLPSELRDAAE